MAISVVVFVSVKNKHNKRLNFYKILLILREGKLNRRSTSFFVVFLLKKIQKSDLAHIIYFCFRV